MYPDWAVQDYDLDNPRVDLDDVHDLGPENINLPEPAGAPYEGWYEIFVHDYPLTEVYEDPNEATVRIWVDGHLEETFEFEMVGEDADHYVARVYFPGGTIEACDGLDGCP